MTSIQLRFSRRKVQSLNFITHASQHSDFSNDSPLVKGIRNQIKEQVNKIEDDYLFKSNRQGLTKQHITISNPERLYSKLALQETPKKSIKSTASAIENSQSYTPRKRRNTFLTVVSRLPQCKKRSESLF